MGLNNIERITEGSVSVIGYPYDQNYSYLPGAGEGPQRIIEALHNESSNTSTENALALTREMARAHGRAWLHIDVEEVGVHEAARTIGSWIARFKIGVLNVAGPRASQDPEIYAIAERILREVLRPPEGSQDPGSCHENR